VPSAIPSELVGLALFFTPGLATLVYAFIKGKGNLKDGLSRVLTELSQGYFQPNVGGENIPVAQGELSDLAGDEPLFKALYKWCAPPLPPPPRSAPARPPPRPTWHERRRLPAPHPQRLVDPQAPDPSGLPLHPFTLPPCTQLPASHQAPPQVHRVGPRVQAGVWPQGVHRGERPRGGAPPAQGQRLQLRQG
jgi:hypothetical protein